MRQLFSHVVSEPRSLELLLNSLRHALEALLASLDATVNLLVVGAARLVAVQRALRGFALHGQAQAPHLVLELLHSKPESLLLLHAARLAGRPASTALLA